ncbi:hypothetical protein A1O3_06572 [Capronia epimyces CBS 606.96]|uniref:Uncharacterized protein n=1 Tax=Capronia epimyces CBS 606.96 TaxID=1182542 RepID=W9XQC9_9EURO|nr:uncharacterized protein A1O3_06572 [Capronia epimyces CBS 606.96]EXJ82757.1 hypothetical protein A1O3_06572 [Capronia epimyces CBS 606.96]
MSSPAALKSKVRLTRPFVQNFVVGCILFCLPGIYVAITGLGAGGGKASSAEVANNINAILYGIFSFGALVVGFVLNKLKPRTCLMIGGIGYPVYVAGLWYFDRTGNDWFPYLGGTVLGCTSGFLWTAAAYVQFSYPEEHCKGLYISIQWSIRAVGATVGALIAFGANFHQTKAVGVSTPVYAVFVVIHCAAIFIAFFFIVDPATVVRDDGTHIAVFKRPHMATELKILGQTAIEPKYLILAIPMLACEMALALASSVSSKCFNLRTRTVNNIGFQGIQFVVPFILAMILDNPRVKSRRRRGLFGAALMSALAIGACAGLLGWMEVHNVDYLAKSPAWDWTDSQFGGFFVLYVLFGSIYSGYQMVVEWTLGATTNDPVRLAKVAGLLKSYSSFGMFISFILAGQKVKFYIQTTVQIILYALGALCMVYTLMRSITNTNYFKEENVIVPRKFMEDATIRGEATDEQVQLEHDKKVLADSVAVTVPAEKGSDAAEVGS